MMRRTLLSLQRVAIAASLAFVFAAQSANADLIVLTINSPQSNLNLSGGAFGLDFVGQGPGSLQTSLSGTITADLTAGVLTFSGGSVITVNANPNGPFSIAPNPGAILGAQNFGVTATGDVGFPFGLSTINGVYSGLAFDITTGTAQNGAALATGTLQFQIGSTLTFGAATQAGNLPGSSNLTNVSGSNTSSSLVSWDGTTLVLPIAFQTTGGNGRVENWTGTITAVPEPTSLGLVALVGIGFAVARRRMGATTQAC